MNIPANYFKKNVTAASVSANNIDLSCIESDHFQLSSTDPIAKARVRIQNSNENIQNTQPHQVYKDTSQILARFLEDETDASALNEVRNELREKVLTQFPVFALNEDYMRALTMIIMEKLERA